MLLSDLITKVREAAYDRFPTPLLYVKKVSQPTWRFVVSSSQVKVVDPAGPTDKFLSTIDGVLTYEQLFEALIQDDDYLSVAYSWAYRGSEIVKDVIPTSTPLAQIAALCRKYFFDDVQIKQMLTAYFMRYNMAHCTCLPDDTALQTYLDKIPCANENHPVWWIAFYLVEMRRAAELAGHSLDIAFTNDEAAFCGGIASLGLTSPYGSTTATVGDVFSMTLDENPGKVENLAFPGADNIFGDDGFWYRLQAWLRERIERFYGDYSLRPNQVMESNLRLEKGYNINAYFDSFPYEIWTYPSKVPPSC